ncbi:recombinase RecT [Pseudoxanthomonas sp. JBR18]|uniref:recombinase RecT n=1 Tax=Pseudoxanthomonas sp. JBR18 TaxID=2969308 RepID=UPI00230559B1|nr:recombinase RecT [Pseudoxanthomonas sp. JBR18]WCE04468.1 recombinase RecT [Pseudoxanthomonas sp. JBR18]
MNNIINIEHEIYSTKDAFMSVLADRSISFDREAEFAIQLLYGNDYAMKIAMANKQSVINAVVNIAAIGISLNPAKKQAYLVPRDGKICLDISYMGLMDLAIESGSIRWGQAELVYSNDTFMLNGVDREPVHKRDPFSRDRGEVVGAYAVVKTPEGDYLTECMSRDEIDGIMSRSQSVRSGKASPWKTDWGEMAKKTVVKRGYKYWPKTDRLDQAIHHLNTDAGEGLAILEHKKEPARAALPAPVDSPERDALYARLSDIAEGGTEAYAKEWKALTPEQRKMIGGPAHEGLKDKAELADAEVAE